MKILVTSDLHGYLPKIEKEFDILMICGDICPAHDHYYAYQYEWFKIEFIDWVNNLPNKEDSKVILVPGNHDFYLERITENDINHYRKISNQRLIILKNKEYVYSSYDEEMNEINLKIFGTPYCKIFGNWAFMVSDDILDKKYSLMPDDVDIMLSHDSPSINGLGMINKGFQKGIDAGNKVLDKYIELKKPKYFFSGHIHSGNHECEKIGDTMMANVSYIDESYIPTYGILDLDIDKDKNFINKDVYYPIEWRSF